MKLTLPNRQGHFSVPILISQQQSTSLPIFVEMASLFCLPLPPFWLLRILRTSVLSSRFIYPAVDLTYLFSWISDSISNLVLPVLPCPLLSYPSSDERHHHLSNHSNPKPMNYPLFLSNTSKQSPTTWCHTFLQSLLEHLILTKKS